MQVPSLAAHLKSSCTAYLRGTTLSVVAALVETFSGSFMGASVVFPAVVDILVGVVAAMEGSAKHFADHPDVTVELFRCVRVVGVYTYVVMFNCQDTHVVLWFRFRLLEAV